MSGIGQIMGGVAANQSAAIQAVATQEAGEIEAADKRRATRRLIASQTVAFAGSGVDIGVGTPLDVLGDTVAESELEALRIQFVRTSQARALKAQGQAAFVSGAIGGTASILSQGASFGLGG